MRFNEQLINLPHLDQVIDRSPLTIHPDNHVADAIILINQEQSQNLGHSLGHNLEIPHHQWQFSYTVSPQENCLLVVAAGQLLGIFSYTELIRLIASGRDLTKVKVAEVMNRQVVTMTYEARGDIFTAWSLLRQHQIHHLPILDTNGQLLGVVSETRILAALDVMKVTVIATTLQQYLQPTTNQTLLINQQISAIGCQTRNYLRQWVEAQSTQLMQFNLELQQTLKELQVVEEQLRQQNEQLLVANQIAELERQRYQDLFEFAPDGYLVTNTSGIIQEANQAAASLLSTPQKHLIGLSLVSFIAPPDNLTFISHLRNSSQPQNYEISIQLKQQQIFPASVRVAPVYDPQGQQTGWRWLLCDITQRQQIEAALRQATENLEHRIRERTAELLITNQRLQQEIIERQRAEEALRQSEQLYRQLVEYQAELIARIDLHGNLIFANQAFCQTFGLDLQQFHGQSVWPFVHPDDLNTTLKSIAAVATAPDQVITGEVRGMTVNGLRWWQWNIAGIEDETGKVVEIQAVGRDITAQKQTAEALRESEQKFRYFAENTNVIIWISDPCTWQNTYLNPAYERISGRSIQDLRENPGQWLEVIHPEDRDRILAKLEILKQGQPTDVEYRIIRPDGTVRWIWDRGFPIPDAQGNIFLYGGVAEDITERKQAEESLESLRESEARLKLALEAGQMGIWDWNIANNQAVWSDNMALLYGLPYGTCLNHEEFIHCIHPDDRELVLEAELNSIKQGIPHIQEYRVIWPEGDIYWLTAKGQTYYDQNQQPIRMIGVTRDISARKQAEQTLQEREKHYRSVVSALGEGIIILNTQGEIITCNPSAAKILNVNSEQVVGDKLIENYFNRAIHEDGSPFPVEQHPSSITLHNGQPCSNVVMGVYVNNEQVTWISINSQPLFRENETQLDRVVISFRDISDRQMAIRERKQAEEKIREQAALLDIATNAIFVQDFYHQILFWNQGAERLYGWHSLEVLNRNPRELFYSKTIPKIETIALETVMQSGSWRGELNKLSKSGQEIIVESHWTIVKDEAGNPKSILTVETDITEKKQLQSQFLRNQRLESIGTLAGGIAHDLNNILTPILGSAQLLRGKFANDLKRHQQLLPIIEENAKRGADLVKQVLSFARGFKGERTDIQVRHLIREIIQFTKQTFPKSIKITTEIVQDLWVISGDSTQIHQVLMNLVLNSRDAMPDGGNLKITAENLSIDEAYAQMHFEAKVGNYILITVADTGMGMCPEILDRIFEPFFTTKEVGAGTGLGLSTVLGIMKSHNGFVTVSSEVGKGTIFKLFIPAVKATKVENTDTLQILDGRGEVILIVDDEAPVRDITKLILENHHYQTLTANNGIEAIAIYAQHQQQISAVIMDMMMPEMDGLTAIRTLQKINPQVPIIACTGFNTNYDVPVQAVLYKPYTAKDLLQNLHQILHRASS